MKALTVLIAGFLALGGVAHGAPMPARWNPSRSLASEAPSKKDVLAKLKNLQEKQMTEATELGNAITKQLNETMKLDLGGDELSIAGRRTNLVTKKIDELNKRRTELNARREIVDRLIFQIDSKWDGKSPLKDFLSNTFIEMASADLSDGRDNRLWKEFTYLSMVMREVSEKSEDVVALFEGYLNFSSVLDPKTPADFMASRNYTNGIESAQARTNERSSIGDGLGPASQGQSTPLQIRTALGIPPSPAETAQTEVAEMNDGTTNGTVSATTQSAAPAPAPTPIAKSKTETAEKAQLDSGQVPMSQVVPAGKAGSPDAAPLQRGANRASTSTKGTAQSAENLRVYHDKQAEPTPTPQPSK